MLRQSLALELVLPTDRTAQDRTGWDMKGEYVVVVIRYDGENEGDDKGREVGKGGKGTIVEMVKGTNDIKSKVRRRKAVTHNGQQYG